MLCYERDENHRRAITEMALGEDVEVFIFWRTLNEVQSEHTRETVHVLIEDT